MRGATNGEEIDDRPMHCFVEFDHVCVTEARQSTRREAAEDEDSG